MYFRTYLKNYSLQFINAVAKVASLLVITPLLAKDTELFTIYLFGLSLMAVINYADLGFFRAAQKYAAEFNAVGDIHGVYRTIGFGTFVFMAAILLLITYFVVISINPEVALPNLRSHEQVLFARALFIVITLSIPLVIVLRMLLAFYDVNLSSYRYYFLNVASSFLILLIAFVLVVFDSFSILSYFISLQIVQVVLISFLLYGLKYWHGYSLKYVFKNIRFSRVEYNRTKRLASASIVTMIAWVVFYEIDLIILVIFVPLESLSDYSLSLVLLGFFRTISGILFGLFGIRLNHLQGSNDLIGFSNYSKIFLYTVGPIIFYLSFTFVALSDTIIPLWLGESYTGVSFLSSIMISGYGLSFVSYIASAILIARDRLSGMLIISVLQPFVYWILVYSLIDFHGILIVATLKFGILILTDAIFLFMISKELGISFAEIYTRLFRPILYLFIPYILVLRVIANFVVMEIESNGSYVQLLTMGFFVIPILMLVLYLHVKLTKLNLSFIN